MPKVRIWPESAMRPGECNSEWLLRMLLQDLQTLASDAENLIRAYPPMIDAVDQVVNDLADHLEFGNRFVQEGLITQDMLDRVRVVDSLVDQMSQRHDSSLWTYEALRKRTEWEEVRRLAREALATMGYDLEPPPPWEKVFRIVPVRK